MADQDHVFKLLFAHPRLASDLVREFLPRAVAREVDPSTLEAIPAEHLSDRLEIRIGDLVWRLRLRDGGPVYLLLEFQSRPDRAMALRMLAYATLFAQGLVRRGEMKGRRRLPPILSVVLYNGQRPWRAPVEVANLLATVPRSIAKYGPRQRYLLLDVERLPQSVGDDNLAALLFRLDRSRSEDEAESGLEALRRGLDRESPELRRAFGIWLGIAFEGRGWSNRAEGSESMLQQTIAKLKRQYLAEGIVAGEARILLRQLAFKFGPLDAATREKVATASPDQLAVWAERLLVAPTLGEVFTVS